MFTLLVIKKTQMKTTIRYHFTPIRIALIKKTKKKTWKITSVDENVEK